MYRPTSGIVTTDRTGSNGYSAGNYYTDFGGTSASAPMVSGVAALMLQANPNLSWRDVQQILMTTATKNDPTDGDWTTNGAGYNINHLYGFGRVDAAAAVSVATTWAPVGQETSVSASASPGLAIPDNDPTGVSSTLSIGTSLAVEYVDVYFSASDHTWWDDLEVTLTSPQGTQSVLATAEFFGASNGESYNMWRFGSTRHLHENSSGNWTLTVKDLAPFDPGTFEYWRIVVYGTAAPAGTFAINNGASYATTHTASLDSTVTNGAEMRFRDAGGTWSDWESYNGQKAWTLPAGEGSKTVEAEYRDRLGRTLALSDSITVDTQGPAGTFVIDEDAAEVATTSVSLDSTVTDADEMRFRDAPSGSWSSWEAYGQHRAWTLPGPDGTKTVEAEFRDVANNVLALSDSIRLETGAPSAPTSLTATAGDQTVDLAWANPTGDFAATRALRSTTEYATSPTPDATQTQIYEGTDEALSDTPLTNGQQYFYTFFSRDILGNWSEPATITATPAAPTQTTSTATRVSTVYGTRVDISGTLTADGGATPLVGRTNVSVLRSPDGVTWSNDGTAAWNGATARYEAARTITEKTVDFGASDAPLSDSELAKAPGIQHIPTTLGAVVVTYNVEGLSAPLKLDGPTVAGIYLGKIKKWNDAAIAGQNAGVTLPDADIVVVHRSDGSGTSYVFTEYLTSISDDWKNGPGTSKNPQWPTGTGGQGNEGVSQQVKQNKNSIGYVELVYTLQNKLPTAQIKNQAGEYITPSTDSTSLAAQGVTLPADYRASIVNSPTKGAYPIAAFTYILLYKSHLQIAVHSQRV